eukprot:jgi/Astpho2/4700/e_gw1.00067.403.1_t
MRDKQPAVIVIAGTSSGVGKSTVSLGLMALFRRRGVSVQPFRLGPGKPQRSPHHLPGHTAHTTGRPVVNLDDWLSSHEDILQSFWRHAADADLCIVDGVAGLIDVRWDRWTAGSTAVMAKLLGAPVLFVVDCGSASLSGAAAIKGVQAWDPDLRLEGILLNKVAGEPHKHWICEALQKTDIQAKVLGGIPRNIAGPMPLDPSLQRQRFSELADLMDEHLDIQALVQIAGSAKVRRGGGGGRGGSVALHSKLVWQPGMGWPMLHVRVAVARDAAFSFYYHDNLRLLEEAGADLVTFSPLTEGLPHNIGGLYLGGGYPERHAQQLAANRGLMQAVRAFADGGGVVYAESGGLIALSQSIQPLDELPSRMAGVFPFRTSMSRRGGRTGYVEVEARQGCLFPAGCKLRGHICHSSEILQVGGFLLQTLQADGASEGRTVPEGYTCNNVLASYVHVHFASCPEAARALVERCRQVDIQALSQASPLLLGVNHNIYRGSDTPLTPPGRLARTASACVSL